MISPVGPVRSEDRGDAERLESSPGSAMTTLIGVRNPSAWILSPESARNVYKAQQETPGTPTKPA
jgi:hypothetical protein